MLTTRDDVLQFSGFQLFPSHRKLIGSAGEIALRAKSFDVLIYLAKSPGRVISKTELLDAIWPDVTVSDESLERCISDIRAALSDSNRSILKTVSRRGYILAADVERAATVSLVPRQRSRVLIAALGVLFLLASLLLFRVLLPQPDRPQLLAVLPIHNASGQKSQDYFADGLTEDLTATLTRLKSIGSRRCRVIRKV